VGRFDAGTRPDWVFAVRAVEPTADHFRQRELLDPAGRTPHENLSIFLRGDDWTYNDHPFVSVDTPVVGTIRGPLEIAGWALGPHGVAEVIFHFGNDRVSFKAERRNRLDVQALMPWYPKTTAAGFHLTIEKPPKSVRGATDLQIEVVGGNGERRMNPPIWFHWLPALKEKPIWRKAELRILLDRLEAPPWSYERLLNGVSSIQDFAAILVTHRSSETNFAFCDRTLRMLFDSVPPAMRSRYLELLGRDIPRDRIVEEMLMSNEFREHYLDGGAITIDGHITAEP
jgi:hypothetical protein